ncbi:PREDICTED: trypsin-like isoform X1 [Papilio polytes]|uniref:trypsin-like isoform X1 n=1 Tax=Papilio polytes TaxID=76194 RepID=UPI00067653C0|nr:PREDICTED: trypsin-like isoform X1 [Papilio polytes]
MGHRFVLISFFTICIVIVYGKYHKRDDHFDSLESSSLGSDSTEFFPEGSKGFSKKKISAHVKSVNGTRRSGAKDKNKKGEKAYKVRSGSQRYPFSVSVQRKGTHYATGALIEKKWVLTVAGEFYNVRESIKFFRVRLGTVNCKKGGALLPIKGVEIHPAYSYKKPTYDVALLRLAVPAEYNEALKAIPLSRIKGKVLSAKFLATYWPRLIVRGQVLPSSAQERVQPNSMRVSTQKMIPWSWCQSLMSTLNHTLDESSLCLDPIMSHHSLCLPDAGAPVTADDGLWGITSGWTSDNCLGNPSPTIFTRVSSPVVRAWLDSQLTDV